MAHYLIYIHGLGGQSTFNSQTITAAWTGALRTSCDPQLLSRATISMAWWAELERQAVQANWAAKVGRGLLHLADRSIAASQHAFNVSYSALARGSIEQDFAALDLYMDQGAKGKEFRTAVTGQLIEQLGSVQSANDRVCIVAHSMGTVIALDVLQSWDGGNVDLLITMGGPLGLYYVHEGYARLGVPQRFPDVLHRWVNVYDPADAITWPARDIASLYPTHAGAYRVFDQQIADVRSDTGQRDPHHWYGYLSSYPVGHEVAHFLTAP